MNINAPHFDRLNSVKERPLDKQPATSNPNEACSTNKFVRKIGFGHGKFIQKGIQKSLMGRGHGGKSTEKF